MGNIVELTDVYLEYPDELENVEEVEEVETEEEKEITNTTKLSLEELQKKLEETQSLRL